MALAHSPSIVMSGLVLCLDAANRKSYSGSGTTWTDLSGNGNNGTLTNGPTFNGDNSGNIVFDGINDYCISNYTIPSDSNFSIILWIKYKGALLVDRGIISTWDSGWNGLGIAFSSFQSSNNIRSWARNGAGGGMNWGVLPQNIWTHLCLTYTSSSKTQIGYINGQLANQEVMGGTSLTHSTLEIGRGGKDSTQQLTAYPNINADISTVQLYNRALSAAEVQQNFNATRGRYGI